MICWQRAGGGRFDDQSNWDFRRRLRGTSCWAVRSGIRQARTRFAEIIREGARLVFERLSVSDALYHNAEHTAFVTLVGQDMLRGERLKHDVPPIDWLHFWNLNGFAMTASRPKLFRAAALATLCCVGNEA
jgi:hypothetical protein